MPTEEPKPAPEPLTDLEIHNLQGTMSRMQSGTSTRYGYVQQDTDIVFKAVVRLVRERAELREALAKCDLQEALLREEIAKLLAKHKPLSFCQVCGEEFRTDALWDLKGNVEGGGKQTCGTCGFTLYATVLEKARKKVADAEDRAPRRQAEQGAASSDAGRADVLAGDGRVGANWEHSE